MQHLNLYKNRHYVLMLLNLLLQLQHNFHQLVHNPFVFEPVFLKQQKNVLFLHFHDLQILYLYHKFQQYPLWLYFEIHMIQRVILTLLNQSIFFLFVDIFDNLLEINLFYNQVLLYHCFLYQVILLYMLHFLQQQRNLFQLLQHLHKLLKLQYLKLKILL